MCHLIGYNYEADSRSSNSFEDNSGAGMVVTGKNDGKSSPDTFLAGNPYLSAMAGNDPLGNGQTQSRAFSLEFWW